MEAGGAAWTRAHPPIDLVECNRTQTLDFKAAETKENLLTLEMMKRYGWRNVRGGWFCNVDETLTEKALKAHGLLDLMKSFENEHSGSSKGSLEQPDICADYQPTVNSPPLKKVTISSVGSCDTATRQGFYEALMECNGRRKYLKRDLTDTTANRCIIQGLIDGVSNLKEPCEVILVAATSLAQKSTKGGRLEIVFHAQAELRISPTTHKQSHSMCFPLNPANLLPVSLPARYSQRLGKTAISPTANVSVTANKEHFTEHFSSSAAAK